ncbi:MAG: nucleoside deaminase [Candidatus Omnitrophota bacterium]|jgi:tRNA(Arg) A34 adenosine deaminase TadA
MMQKKYMCLAIKEAELNLKNIDGGPFGACIVKGNKILAVARSTVLKNDATSHAEINAIRKASKKIRNFDLSGAVLYSTTEPCPMCFSATHWARISTIVYGTNISDAKRIGFNELKISNFKIKRMGKSKIKIVKGFMLKECRKLFEDWGSLENKRLY